MRGLHCRGFVQASDFDFISGFSSISVLLISGLHGSGFVQASDFESYKRMLLFPVFLKRMLRPAGKQIACELTTRRNTLKKQLKKTWSKHWMYFSRLFTCVEPQNVSKIRDSCRRTQLTRPWCSMKFHYGAFVYSPTRTRLLANQNEALRKAGLYKLVYYVSIADRKLSKRLRFLSPLSFGANTRNRSRAHWCRRRYLCQ